MYHMNIIAMKDIIAVIERGGKNKELLAIKNTDKTAMTEVAKMSNAINFGSKYNWVISNTNIDVARNLKLINIKKY